MDFKNLRIGYVPYLPDLSQPGDRRRFPYFAKRNYVAFEIADKNKEYDIILLTAPANLSKWLLYKRAHKETRFIFEMTDSLILSSGTFSTLFKGVGRFILRKESRPYLNYIRLLKIWLKIADVVLCSSTELKKIILQWNSNVIVSLDYLQNETKFLKSDYGINNKMKLVWEGQSVVLPHLLVYKEVFRRVNSFCELHVITDEDYPVYGGISKKDTETILDKLPIETIFHKWEIYENFKELGKYDCGIIPLDKSNTFAWHKPANKLISFWFTGVPALVSNTPAYIEMMKKAGEEFYCSSVEDWVAKINAIKNMKDEERASLAQINLAHVTKHYSDEALDLVWFNVFKLLS